MSAHADKLNAAQREAITHEGGPLIVLAGPGTGKTRVIIHRIAHMIGARRIAPERIVALTFSVRAAEELRERLAEVAEQGEAMRVRAGTLHALGASIVRRFADVLGLPARVEMLDRALERRWLSEVVLDAGLFRSVRGAGMGSLCERLLREFGEMSEHAVSPERAIEYAGKLRAEHDDERSARIEETARAYDLFTARRWERGRLLFSDFVLMPVMAMSRDAGLRAMVRSEIDAIVVDEFQDCNPGQIELLALLAGGGRPDLCVVGDDDQAIYAFRGADERAFERFERHWPGPRVIELTENHRCAGEIIDVANSVIERAHHRYRPQKRVVRAPGALHPPGPTGVQITRLRSDLDDGEAIAAELLLERHQARMDGRAFSWDGYTVLARTRSDLDRVAWALELEGIPVRRVRESSVFEDEGVRDALAWAGWILDARATWCARRVLARAPYGVDVSTLSAWEREHREECALRREKGEAERAYHEWLRERVSGDQSHDAAAAWRALGVLARLREATCGVDGATALEAVVRVPDLAHAELLDARARARRVAALVSLLRVARDRVRDVEQPGDLRAMIAHLDALREVDPRLESASGHRAFDAGSIDDEELDDAGAGEGRVTLLTGHSAKGLEFDVVVVTRVTPPHGFPKSARENEESRLPAALLGVHDATDEVKSRADEERRLFYVACTRAKRRLILLSSHKGRPSRSEMHFVDELVVRPAEGVRVPVVESSDVLARAARAGLGVLARGPLESAGVHVGGARVARERRDRVRGEARRAAAGALDSLAREGVEEREFEAALRELEQAARMIAIASREGQDGAPEWLTNRNDRLRELDLKLRAFRAGEAGSEEEGVVRLPAPASPLSLSFTSIREYLRCPRCWYLSDVLKFRDGDSPAQRIGTAAHRALERFGRACRDADATGGAKPTMDLLLSLGRKALLEVSGGSGGISREEQEQLTGQLRTYYERLHAPDAHIVEVERWLRGGVEVDGVTHTIVARIDRIDLGGDGRLRVIDYKTGRATKSLLEPDKDDLQMGLYAMMLAREQAPEPLRGTAEYWALSSGERGVIEFEALDQDKIRVAIERMVRGALSGRYERGRQCKGPCNDFF